MNLMKQVMPQEIEIWYLIPAFRREFAKIFVRDYGFRQKEVSKILGITEASVSNYLKSKRGEKINFSVSEIKKIKESAKRIAEEEASVVKELYGLCMFFKESKGICKVHKSMDNSIEKSCDVCY
jgi:predicted transcriptional regulator